MVRLLTVAALLLHTALAAWNEQTHTGFPSDDDCYAHMAESAADTCLFYTGQGSWDALTAYRDGQPGLVTIFDNPPDVSGWMNYDTADAPQSVGKLDDGSPWDNGPQYLNDYIRFAICMSKAYARRCSGKILVFMPTGITPTLGIWKDYEEPIILGDHGRYPEVWRVERAADGSFPSTAIYPACTTAPAQQRAVKKRQPYTYLPLPPTTPDTAHRTTAAPWPKRTRLYPIMPRWANTTTSSSGGIAGGPVQTSTIVTIGPDGQQSTAVVTVAPSSPTDGSGGDPNEPVQTATFTTIGSDGQPTTTVVPVQTSSIVTIGPDNQPTTTVVTIPPPSPTDGSGGDPNNSNQSSASDATTITATGPDGQTTTGVFTESTITSLESLTSETTITTDTSGTPVVITVGPHGVVWWPLGVIPAVVPFPTAPPLGVPDGNSGDQSDPNDSDGPDNEDSCPVFNYADSPDDLPPGFGPPAGVGSGSPSPPDPQPSAEPSQTCNSNSVGSLSSQIPGANGNISPDDLLYTLREVICNNRCDQPAGLASGIAWAAGHKADSDCELSVAIDSQTEAYFYRGTSSTGDQWQQCWDETQSIIEQCVKNGPNEGWVNGPSQYQFYQGGFRPLNGAGSLHAPFSADTPAPTPGGGTPSGDGGTGAGSSTGGIVAPNNVNGVTCGNNAAAGVQESNCLELINGLVVGGGFSLSDGNSTQGICTDSDFCLSKGDSKSSDGQTTYGSYCEVLAANGCAFVLATKSSSFGGTFPGRDCVSPADINSFVRSASTCPGSDAWSAGFKPGASTDDSANFPYTVMALVNSNAAGSVYAP